MRLSVAGRGDLERVAAPARAEARGAAAARRWAVPYLIVATALAPLVVPSGPGQTALGDAVNVLALVGFAAGVGRAGDSARLPLLTPLLLVAAGSLMATVAAVSLAAAGLTLAQDLYLYLWFAMLVSLMRAGGDLRRVRLAWLWTADAVAAVGLLLLPHGGIGQMSSAAGPRAASTLYNPNMFADYLVLSVFNALGLLGQVRARWLAPSLGLLLVALVATKSNGGWLSLGAGLVFWTISAASAARVPAPRIASLVALLLAVALGAGWLLSQSGSASAWVRELAARSYVGRIQHSSSSREAIWRGLVADLTRSPLGIGPGNSAARQVPIGERERPDSFQAKEAHSDYLAYAVERGPLGLAGLLLALGATFARLGRGGAALVRRAGNARAGALIRAALLGALVASVVHSLVIERLHFRHAWLFLAVLWALTDVPPQPASGAGAENGHAPPGRGLRPAWAGPGRVTGTPQQGEVRA